MVETIQEFLADKVRTSETTSLLNADSAVSKILNPALRHKNTVVFDLEFVCDEEYTDKLKVDKIHWNAQTRNITIPRVSNEQYDPGA